MDINTYIIKGSEIKQGKNKGKAPLRFSFFYNGLRINIGADERALVKAWDISGQKVSRKDPDGVEINKRILKKKGLLIEAVQELEKKDVEPNQKNIKALYQIRIDEVFKNLKSVARPLKKESIKLPTTFWEVVEHYRKNSKNSKETIRKFKQVEKHLKEYNPKIDFKDFTEDFYNDYFLGYLVDVPICDNTIDKHIAEIKKICTYAITRFNHIPIPKDFLDFKRMYQNPFRLSLSWEEVKKIEEFVPLHKELVLAQDLFLISCYTGLRWQNVSKIKDYNIVEVDGSYHFQGITFKNSRSIQFVLSPKVVKILNRYKNNIPKSYNSDINKDIQKIARAAGLKDLVSFTKLYNGKPKVLTCEKWQKVTMHVGRHSFARRFLEMNKAEGALALQSLKELLGHSSAVITEIYLKLGDDKKNKMLLSAIE
ncbi:phage integrase SAM-like domain-containing protein [Cyclobacterium jeungdonense]|uniref:Phage integrase SAM-like domain-containing protein n=1 Tax=Cyclobacterium jeungdonense TaxID=708087 RepID=A0ABT8C6Y9_9BACT|nr:phage integrase SAM-like domain-containing protein [Cyclobacterium jeungdonense]MDN3687403.1 phage integrase SAM-like domain-containing protein [Cyclobacterium jeungdonense]